MDHAPTPVVALNRAVALAEVVGPAEALEAIDGLDLDGYHLFHAARADFLLRLGRSADAASATAPRWPSPPTTPSGRSSSNAGKLSPIADDHRPRAEARRHEEPRDRRVRGERRSA